MIEDLIIHIGNHKAGTTSFQTAFYNGQVKADIFYPLAHPDSPVKHNHNWYARSVGTDREESVMEYMKNQIKDKKRVLISAAWYTYLTPERLKQHIDEHYAPIAKNIRIIQYLRPAIEFWRSRYVEITKIGDCRVSFEDFYKATPLVPLYYDKTISHLKQGYDITVKPFVKEALYRNDVIDDIAHFCVGNDYEIISRSVENIAISAQYLSAIMFMHTLFYDRDFDQVRNDGYILTEALQKHIPLENPVAFHIPPHIIKEIATSEEYIKDAALMDELITPGKTYLSDNLKKHLENLPETSISLDVKDWHSEEAIQMMKAWAEFYMITEKILKK